MEEWKGITNYIARGFYAGSVGDDGKGTRTKATEPPSTLDQVKTGSCYGIRFQKDIIDISFDNEKMAESVMAWIRDSKLHTVVLKNPKNGHIHTFWKNERKRISTGSAKDVPLAVGFMADIHGGDSYTPLCALGVKRPIVPDVSDVEHPPDEVPAELLPVKKTATSKNIFGMKDGDGRDQLIYSSSLRLQRELHLQDDVIRRILYNMNTYAFADPLDDDVMAQKVRPEAFEKGESFVEDMQDIEAISAADLSHEQLQPVRFLIPNFLPVGLTILAAPPKTGKSWLVLDMGLSIASGSDFLGFHTNRAGVLYLSLEDSFNRLQLRMNKVLQGKPAPDNFFMGIQCQTLDTGLIQQLQDFIRNHKDTGLIIIDIFTKIRSTNRKNESAYTADYRDVGELKKFADTNGIGLLLVHHDTKRKDFDDPFVNISGTQGISGAADTNMIISKKKRFDDLGKLSIAGRDVDMNEYAISFSKDSCRWTKGNCSFEMLEAQQEEVQRKDEFLESPILKTIRYLIKKNHGKWQGRASDLIKASTEAGPKISGSATAVGKKLIAYEKFYEMFQINFEVLTHGKSSNEYRFSQKEDTYK